MKIVDKDIKKLTIEELFNLEYKMHKNLSKLKRNIKKTKNVYCYKNILININNIKEEYDLTNIDIKLRYLKNEYNFLIKLNKIKRKDINFLKRKLFNKKINSRVNIYNPTLQKFDKHISKNDLIKFYKQNIEILLKTKMIYDGKLYYLEHLYNNPIKKC